MRLRRRPQTKGGVRVWGIQDPRKGGSGVNATVEEKHVEYGPVWKVQRVPTPVVSGLGRCRLAGLFSLAARRPMLSF
jgi:hypothetical protein